MTGMNKQKQLIMFMTGAGGSGKTKVINAVLLYAKRFCKDINYEFDKRMIVVTALTGVAATLINGETTHSAAKLNCKSIETEHILEWKHTRLVIIDEISFANADVLTKLHIQLQALKEVHGEKFGNLHVIFTGDFCQLEPVTGHPLYYETNFAIWHDWVNCFIELTGQHRFKKDPSFGAIMNRIHNGCPTTADIALLNSRVLNGTHPASPKEQDLPDDVSYAVYRNADKSAINNGVFAEHLKKTHSTNPSAPIPVHTLVVRSDELTWKYNKKAFGPTARHSLWSGCSETHVKTTGEHGKFVDPFLKLSTNIPLMYTENHDVPNGIANGTLCNLVKIVLHTHVTEADFKIMNIDGYYVRTIDATNVNYLLCRIHESTRTFEVRPDTVTCKIDLPFELIPGEKMRKIVRAKVNRFPLLINHATTGHKLQGQTKLNLCISDWHYGANWPYVVLSRVTSLKGLFLLKPLRQDHDFSHDQRLTRMLIRMRTRTPTPYDPDA
jgi:ATP:corrinoid adenosyltransferase